MAVMARVTVELDDLLLLIGAARDLAAEEPLITNSYRRALKGAADRSSKAVRGEVNPVAWQALNLAPEGGGGDE